MEATKPAMATDKYQPSSCIYISKQEASRLKIGDNTSLTIKGSVTGINQDYNDKNLYRVEIKQASIGKESPADKSYSKLTKGE